MVQAKQAEGDIQIKIRCSKCDSTQNYLKIRTMERVCRSCGNIEKVRIGDNQDESKKHQESD